MQVLDADARIFLFEKFLTDDECDHIIRLSEDHMSRSGVVESQSGGSKVSEIRTSSGVFLNRGQDEVIKSEFRSFVETAVQLGPWLGSRAACQNSLLPCSFHAVCMQHADTSVQQRIKGSVHARPKS